MRRDSRAWLPFHKWSHRETSNITIGSLPTLSPPRFQPPSLMAPNDLPSPQAHEGHPNLLARARRQSFEQTLGQTRTGCSRQPIGKPR